MREIPIDDGEFVALVDDEDYDRINAVVWHDNWGVVQGRLKGKTVSMHRMVMKATKSIVVHHKNKNKRDNRKENLVRKTAGAHRREHNIDNTEKYESWLKEKGFKKHCYATLKEYRLNNPLDCAVFNHKVNDFTHTWYAGGQPAGR